MPTLHFTRQLERFLSAPSVRVEAQTLADALAAVFEDHPQLSGYVVDDQGAIRQHVAIFIDGVQVQDRTGLSDPVARDSEIYVFQALSGG